MIERFPRSEVPRYSLGSALKAEGKLDEAVEHLAVAVEVKPDFMMAWIQLGEAHMAREDWDGAKSAIQAALKLATDQDHQGPKLDCEALLEEIQEELDGI